MSSAQWGRWDCFLGYSPPKSSSHSQDHHFGGLNQRGSGLPRFQVHLAGGSRRDDRRDLLIADGDNHLRHQSTDAHVLDPANQLIPAAQAAHDERTLRSGSCSGSKQQAIHLALRNPVMSASGSNAAYFLLVDPLLDRWEADAKLQCGFTRFE